MGWMTRNDGPPTPALLLDRSAYERNLGAMRRLLAGSGASLRPHVKTHKCTRIARRQLREGAGGLSCAVLDEAEAMADAGLSDLLLTSPVVGDDKIRRLRRLADRTRRLLAVVDDPQNIAQLSAAFRRSNSPLGVLVDVDVGLGRTGVTTPAAAASLAEQIRRSPGLEFLGLQAYSGRLQHLARPEDRRRLASRILDRIRVVIRALGAPPRIVSGGGTGSAALDAASGVFTEVQAGSYVFMDQIYLRNQGVPFAASLRVAATVLSVRPDGSVTVDAGTKHFSRGPLPALGGSLKGKGRYRFAGDEHGRVFLKRGTRPPKLGERLLFEVPHCDPTVNLYPELHVVDGGRVTGTWAIDARRR